VLLSFFAYIEHTYSICLQHAKHGAVWRRALSCLGHITLLSGVNAALLQQFRHATRTGRIDATEFAMAAAFALISSLSYLGRINKLC